MGVRNVSCDPDILILDLKAESTQGCEFLYPKTSLKTIDLSSKLTRQGSFIIAALSYSLNVPTDEYRYHVTICSPSFLHLSVDIHLLFFMSSKVFENGYQLQEIFMEVTCFV